MARHSKRWLPLRFRLRTLLVGVGVLCGSLGWVAHHYHGYLAEQTLIATMATRIPQGRWMRVGVAGNGKYFAGDSYG